MDRFHNRSCDASQNAKIVLVSHTNIPGRRSSVFIVTFEQISHIGLVFPLLTLKE